jgi:predicted phage terminase large subunit-like protein
VTPSDVRASGGTAIEPQPGPQEAFLGTSADIAVYGGAAGGGKSHALLMEPCRHIDNPQFGAVIFRRTLADHKKQGSLWDKSMAMYGGLGARPRQDVLTWKFPSGAKVTFAGLENASSVLDWQGSEISLLAFDELTHFDRSQFIYMLSRNRSPCGIQPYIRCTTNPDSESWVAEFIAWWIDQETGQPIQERSGVLRWFGRVNEELVWFASREELTEQYPDRDEFGNLLVDPKSLTFIPATLQDNPILMQANPGYRANLLAMTMVERERLLGGNWKIKPAAGLYFRREWCEVVEEIPYGTRFVRGWDLAATAKNETNDPDFTCGTKIGRCIDGRFLVAHHFRARGTPLEVERWVKNTAVEDGRACRVHMPEDPGQAGVAQKLNYSRILEGYPFTFKRVSGDKIERFSAFSAQAETPGKVLVLRGPWNDAWFTALESFPPNKGGHDDDADSTAEAYNGLVEKRAMVISDAVLQKSAIPMRRGY